MSSIQTVQKIMILSKLRETVYYVLCWFTYSSINVLLNEIVACGLYCCFSIMSSSWNGPMIDCIFLPTDRSYVQTSKNFIFQLGYAPVFIMNNKQLINGTPRSLSIICLPKICGTTSPRCSIFSFWDFLQRDSKSMIPIFTFI